ncbi:hypothetical protein G6F35_018075 [Rhizopus arrhizus]|nr:hypothetical protein G6F35_018075 [Rhizopus arrhizus]
MLAVQAAFQEDLAIAEGARLRGVHAAQILEAAAAVGPAGHAQRVGQRRVGAGFHQRHRAQLIAQFHGFGPGLGDQQRRRFRQPTAWRMVARAMP